MEEICTPLADRMIAPIEQALAETGLQMSDLKSIEATGGSAQADEPVESDNISEEGAVIDDPKSEGDNIETKDDVKTIPEKELELVTEDEATSEDAQKEN